MRREAARNPIVRAATPLLLAALVLAGCGDEGAHHVAGGTLVVYQSVPRSGPSAAAGRDEADGARLALSQARGMAGDERVHLRVLDSAEPGRSATTPRQVAVNARTARRDKRTVAYLGETEPAASAVSVVILNAAGVLEVSPSDTFAGLTRPAGSPGEPDRYYPRLRRTFARIVPEDNLQAGAVARWMQILGHRRLLLLDDNGLYGRSMAERVGREAERLGLRVVDEQAIDSRPGRLRPQLTDLRHLGADAVFLGADAGADARAAWSGLAQALPGAARFGPGTLATPAFTAGAAPGRLVAPAAPAIEPSFARAYRRRYGRAASGAAARGNAAMAGLLQAIASVPGTAPSRSEVVRAFLGLRMRRSAVGPYVIAPSGDSDLRGTAGIQIHDGRASTVRAFNLP